MGNLGDLPLQFDRIRAVSRIGVGGEVGKERYRNQKERFL